MLTSRASCWAVILLAGIYLSGCTVIFQGGRRSDADKIQELSQQLDELAQAKKLLEDRLVKEIDDKQVKLEMMEKGLVITFVSDVLFDSGKSKIKPEAKDSLAKVARVLNENVPDLNVGIEGHTDNQPIRFSTWKSNWELSTARAQSVLHYLVDDHNVAPKRMSVLGYGEYHPVALNDTADGRALNRRVEIVIVPNVIKVKGRPSSPEIVDEELMSEPRENLK